MGFLGSTLAFPPAFDGRGGLLLVNGPDAVAHHIRGLISSMTGEHVFTPTFGWPVDVFAPIEDADVMAALIYEAIKTWEDRIDAASLRVDVGIGDDDQLVIFIQYSLLGQATTRTLQYGFRLEGAA